MGKGHSTGKGSKIYGGYSGLIGKDAKERMELDT